MGELKIEREIVEETLAMAQSIARLKHYEEDEGSTGSLSVDLVNKEHMDQLLNLATYVSSWMKVDIITEIDEEEGRFKIFLAS